MKASRPRERLPDNVIAEDERLHVFMNRKKQTGWYSNDRELHSARISEGMTEAAANGWPIGRPRIALNDSELAAIIAKSSSLRVAWQTVRRTKPDLSWTTFWRRAHELAQSNVPVQKVVLTKQKAPKRVIARKPPRRTPQEPRDAKGSSTNTRRRAGGDAPRDRQSHSGSVRARRVNNRA